VQNLTAVAIVALAMELSVAVAFGVAAEPIARGVARWPGALRIVFPALFVLPYAAVSISQHALSWTWFGLYAGLPALVAWLLDRAAAADPEQRGNWRDGMILLVLGLAVDLRWFDSAWPQGLRALNELLLLDVGLYGFLAIRRLSGTGFDFCPDWGRKASAAKSEDGKAYEQKGRSGKTHDWKIGLRELMFLTPPVLILGLALGFIHPHRSFLAGNLAGLGWAALRWIGIFFFTAVPEELFFRAWVQNLLERRVGRRAALGIASLVFGLSHFNKRSAHFNWRYVLLATIAGIFYGRAWREQRRVSASAITHTCVDWIWSMWF
jgi:membrane protease YdiL (CAAX protease family)